jgi:hypothetical protein
MKDNEQKELEFKAYGKRVTFHTRHWWILEWLEEQPGRNLADKVWSVVNQAYQQDYAERAKKAEERARTATDAGERLDLICEAMGHYSKAGNSKRHDELHAELWRDMARSGLWDKTT